MIVIYKLYNPPVSGALLLIPIHTLERLGFHEGDLHFMLSADNSCKHKFSNHNYTVMSGNEGNWGGVRVWNQHVTLYLSWQDALQIENEIHLCIKFKDKWESAWKGNYKLPTPYKSFFCNKENNLSKWECSGYEVYYDKKQEIYKLLTKYDKQTTPNKSLKSGTPQSGAT